jgi:hypothetical protein
LKFSKLVAGIAAAVALVAGLSQSQSSSDWFRAAVDHYTHAERERGTTTARARKEPKEHKRGGTLSEREALALYSEAQQEPTFDACADQFPQAQPLALGLVPASMKPLALGPVRGPVFADEQDTAGRGRAPQRRPPGAGPG